MFAACFDIETSSLDARFGVVLCGVVKPWGGPVEVYSVRDYPGVRPSDDRPLVEVLIKRLSEFPVLIAHNGVDFDRPFLNTRAVRHGLPVLDPRARFIDPVKLARRHLRLSYNSLEAVSVALGTKARKTPVRGDVWLRASLDRDEAALEEVIQHCVNDVLVLEEVAMKLQPFLGSITARGSS